MAERPICFTGPEVRAALAGTKTQARRVLWKPRVRLSRPVRSEDLIFLAGKGVQADPGIYPVELNPHGAVIATLPGGERLGLRPGEFDFVCPLADGPTTLAKGWTIAPAGRRLWVQEKHSIWQRTETEPEPRQGVYYEAGIPREGGGWRCVAAQMVGRWRSPAQMPRWAARLLLEVTAVRLERLQAITEADARAEGLRRVSKDGGQTWKWGTPDRDGLPGTDDDGMPWGDWSTDARKPFRLLWDRAHAKTFPWESNPWVWVLAGFEPKWPVFGYRVAGFAERAAGGRFCRPALAAPLVWGLTGPGRGKSVGSGLAEGRLVVAAPTGHLAHHGAAHKLRDRFSIVKHGPDGADVVAGEVDGDAARGAPLGEERRQLGEGGRRGAALATLPREVVDALVAVVPDDAPVEPPPQREVDGLVVYPKKSFWHSAPQLSRDLPPGRARSRSGGLIPDRLRFLRSASLRGAFADGTTSYGGSYQAGVTAARVDDWGVL